MSDWVTLNLYRIKTGPFASSEEDGFNGVFVVIINGLPIRCIASDGMGWRHVSVSIMQRSLSVLPPSWSIMSQVKDLFWDDEDCVVQFHPPKSQYVNNHPGCLHLWQPTGEQIKTPHWSLVGIKGLNPEQFEAAISVGEMPNTIRNKVHSAAHSPGNP